MRQTIIMAPCLKTNCSAVLPLLLVLMITPLQIAGKTSSADPVILIEQDFSDGIITVDEMVLLLLKSVRNPDLLPDRYATSLTSSSTHILRGATMALVKVRRHWNEITVETQLAVDQALARVETEFTFDSPGGFFKMHYDLTGIDAVSSVDNNSDGVSDFVERCAAYMDTSYDVHASMGYLVPPDDGGLGGDIKYDVYFEETGAYGYAVPEGSGSYPWNDFFSYIVLNNDFLGFPSNDDPEGLPAGAAKATAAHEFHHAVQFAYDIGEGIWFMESDATWMEDIVFDHVNDNYNYLGTFFSQPHVSLQENSGHAYSCFIWEMFLSELFEPSLMVAVWEGAISSTIMSTFDDTLMARYGWTTDSAFGEFSAWNFATSIRDDGAHYSEAANYTAVVIERSHSVYPVTTNSPLHWPQGYGSSYVQFFPGPFFGDLMINFNGDNSHQWSAYAVLSLSDSQHEFIKLDLDPIDQTGSLTIEGFQDYYRVTLIGANLNEFDYSSAQFTYSADLTIPYAMTSAVLTTDSLIYSGAVRYYEFLVANNSEYPDIFSIIAWDDSGWIAIDTLEKSLSAGEEAIFSIAVAPPQGTAIGHSSDLYFKAQSWGDPELFEIGTARAVTVLQHGDANFSGNMDINDILYIVDFLFYEGEFPQPELDAGNFNCTADVDVTDLIALVAYLFRGGPAPTCNPY